jgi:hypothetical protein
VSGDQPDPPPPPPSDAPQQTAPAEPPPPPPTDLGTQDTYAEDTPLNFGEQLMTRDGLPADLQTRIRDIERRK